MTEALTGFYLAGMILLAILVVCWIVLPIAVIGTKPILRQILAEQQRTNALLERRLAETPAQAVVRS